MKYVDYLTGHERRQFEALTREIDRLKAQRSRLRDRAQGRGYYAETLKPKAQVHDRAH